MKFFLKALTIVTFLVPLIAENLSAERDVEFLLRKRSWPEKQEEIFRLDSKEAVLKSSFDSSKPTSFLIHGFTEDRNTPHYSLLSTKLLEHEDQNLFLVDWGSKFKTFWYPEAVLRVPKVAEVVGSFVDFLHSQASLNLNKTTIIGMSLGAHISGLAGKNVNGGKVRKIVGLDPAGPSFTEVQANKRLSRDSALYTECIHTGFYFGIRDPICHVDFYINGGRNQPGCKVLQNVMCSHGRAVEIFQETLADPKSHYGLQCLSLEYAELKSCTGKPGAFVNDEKNEATARGIYHVTTNLQSPYGKGFVEM